MKQWIGLRNRYLHILLEMEAQGRSDKCSKCTKKPEIRCPDCFGSLSFCKECCLDAHRNSPFHRPLLWNTTHYTPVTLHSLGFALYIGHGGAPCPQTPEGPSTNLEISDGLFDSLDMYLESNENDASRVRTADSGNPLFTVVDRSGVFDMEIVFCVCSGMDNMGEQLLRAGLFPSTFKQIETLFTFSVLEDFITDNLECKTTAQQYYSKLQSMTSKMFPNKVQNRYKQLLRASRQWRDLKTRMESGLGHQPETESPPDGAMAVFCPACPQPGINLPTDWKTLYPPYVPYELDQLIRTFIMDGNFSAEHMRHKSGEKDVALSAGMAFMANPDSYSTHLQSGKEVAQPSTCNTYRAIEQANSSRAHLDVTGIGATACCHGFFVPTSVVDFQKGERQINMDYSICKALSYNMEDIPMALVMYDIMCQYRVHFQERVKNSPELSLPSSLQLWMGIGLFHIHGHQDSCLPRYSPSYIQGAKQVDGEIIETLWAPLNNISLPSLLKRWKRLKSGLDASSNAYEALNQHFKHKSEQWLKDDECAQQDRQISPSSMDIYDTVKEKGVWNILLIEEESGDHSIHGETSWISCGLKIQELQLAIHYQLRTQGSKLTMEDAHILENKRNRIQKLIDMFEHQADAFLPHLRAIDDALVWSLGDYAEYDNVDDIDDSGNPGPASSGHYHRPHTSTDSGIESLNAEDIPLLLPSSLGWEWCASHSVKTLAMKEAKLRYAQASDSIHRIRLALGFKSALFRTQVRDAQTQKTKTRAWTAVHSVDSTVHEHARNYSVARDAYLKVQEASVSFPELPPLRLTDLRVSTAILGAAQVGQRNKQLPWIWSFGTSERQDGTWMDEFNRVHWLRAKAQFERWKEEQHSIYNEAIWIPAYFHSKAECWKAWMDMAAQALLPGHEAYASRQAHAWEELSKSSIKALIPITSASLKH
ncbi:hypothetical protein EDB83DRAFT_2229595 [Lactarius deliciosus]|nr:hypothetical protein EDB83DRAFT_2229595 [Lactarius deliciosus]